MCLSWSLKRLTGSQRNQTISKSRHASSPPLEFHASWASQLLHLTTYGRISNCGETNEKAGVLLVSLKPAKGLFPPKTTHPHMLLLPKCKSAQDASRLSEEEIQALPQARRGVFLPMKLGVCDKEKSGRTHQSRFFSWGTTPKSD